MIGCECECYCLADWYTADGLPLPSDLVQEAFSGKNLETSRHYRVSYAITAFIYGSFTAAIYTINEAMKAKNP